MTASRTTAVALALLGCAAALATHLGALHASGLDPVSSPIGALARSAESTSFRYGLWVFALGHLSLALLLNGPAVGRFTRAAQLFLAIDAALIAWLPLSLATASAAASASAAAAAAPQSASTAGPLWLLAGAAGFTLTFVAVSLWRRHRTAALWTLVCLLLWTGLAPVFLVVDPNWIGAYQRFVGTVLVAWTGVLAVMIGFRERAER